MVPGSNPGQGIVHSVTGVFTLICLVLAHIPFYLIPGCAGTDALSTPLMLCKFVFMRHIVVLAPLGERFRI